MAYTITIDNIIHNEKDVKEWVQYAELAKRGIPVTKETLVSEVIPFKELKLLSMDNTEAFVTWGVRFCYRLDIPKYLTATTLEEAGDSLDDTWVVTEPQVRPY